RRMSLPGRNAEGFVLWLPVERLESPERDFWLDSDTIDGPRTEDEGGIIDLLTTALDVKWSTDPDDFELAEEFWPQSALWRADERSERRH
ncbi:MAG TPA: hypothetical protein VNS80_00505, partial [Pseudolysinimonas sp.]|nr:hypothetical protein [Pseudolysinimonas sp.]